MAVALLGLVLALPSSAGAFELFQGRLAGKWPGKRPTITYYVAAGQFAKATSRAAAAWNRTGVRIRFAKVKSRRRAEVIVRHLKGPASAGCIYYGFGGPTGSGRPGHVRYFAGQVLLPRLKAPEPTCQTQLIGLLAHELGHVLGLDHETKTCALMNRVRVNGLWPDRCPTPPEGQWRCRVIELDDARGARKLYGGKLRAPVTPENCPIPGYVPDGGEDPPPEDEF